MSYPAVSYPVVAGAVALLIVYVWASITYVYRDAPRRGMDGDQWAGVLAITVGLAFVVYLLRRDPITESTDRA